METKKIQASQYARSLIEASLDPLVTISAEGKITDVNDASVKVTGIAREKLINTDFSDYFTDPKKAKEGYLQVFEKGFVADYPLTIKHKNGKLTDVLYNASVYKDDSGNVLGVFAAARDVTVQKQASQYARSLIEASLDPLVTISAEGKITDVNEASVKVTGIQREKLINTDFTNYFTDPKKAKEGYLHVFEKGFVADYPLTIKHKSGKLTDVLYNASVYKDDKENVLGVFAAARDVTVQKQASQYARSLIEASLDPLVTISPKGKITDVNDASVKVTGIPRKKLINTDFSDYFTDPKKAKEGYLQVFEKGFVADYPLTIKHKNGKLTDVLYNASVYKDDKGNVLGVFAAARDITVQKQASQYARSLIEASLDPLVTISPKGKITDVNDASVKVTGIPRKKLINTDFSDYFTDPKKAKEGYLQVFEKGFVADYPLTIKHKNGKLTDVLYNASVYKDDKGNVLGVFAAARDVNNQKWAIELRKVNKELVLQNKEKEKRADELAIANEELAFQNKEKEKRADELAIANKELAFQNKEKEKRANELVKANKELAFQNKEKEKRADELIIANEELAFQNKEKEKRADELILANKELAFQNKEKEKRADELIIANEELAFQNKEKEKRADELILANEELAFQNKEKEKRADELAIANKELAFQNKEKEKRADELIIANEELAFQNKEKEKRADELAIANKELAFQNKEKEKRANELVKANKELAFQNKEKEKRADELIIANEELAFQNKEKEKRADELIIANKELAFQNKEKEKRADELIIANEELAFQNKEKEKRADELIIANTELAYQIEEKKKAAAELVVLNKKLALKNKEKEKRESELIIANKELAYQIEEKEKKGAELVIVNRKLAFQIKEKEKKALELIITNKELAFQIEEKEKRAAELNIANRKLALQYEEKEKKTIELIIANKELAFQNKENVKLTVELTLINKTLADYKYAIDQSSIVTIIDTDENIKHVNDNFFKISQHSQDELLGHKYPIINPEFHPKEYIRNIQKTIAEGKIWKGELRNKSKDESIYWVNTTIVPFLIKNGKPYQYAIIQFDITDRKKAEQKLKEHLGVLEYQNTQLNDFCYIISHNLRGPLVNISMLVDYIENSDSEKEQKEMLKKIRPVVNKINETFNELVESLQVKYDLKIKLEKINLRLSFEKVLALLEYEITSTNAEIEINISDTPVINFPKKYMNSILFNLISNSLKFRSPDRKPVIQIKTKRIKDRIVLSIADNSLGIDLKMHKKDVFKIRKVFHEHPDARGFGLFMIKTQIEAMGGKIWVESTPDKGSTFFVEFINQQT